MPEHVPADLPCRPGITGAATIAFAREESVLDRVPKHHLDFYYHAVVLPAKSRLDASYMAKATFLSDLKLIMDSVLRRWDSSVMEELLGIREFEAEGTPPVSRRPPAFAPEAVVTQKPIPVKVDRTGLPNEAYAGEQPHYLPGNAPAMNWLGASQDS